MPGVPALLPQPTVRCGAPSQRAVTLRFAAADGVSLDGAIVGTGRIGVALLHEYPGPMCGWWPYATYLARHDVTALLFDFRCPGLLPGASLNSERAASTLRVPALFAVARDDRYVAVADMRAVYGRARSPVKSLTVLPAGAGHGWDMLIGPDFRWSPLAREVLAFIRAHAGPA